jgi:hypothetical protein
VALETILISALFLTHLTIPAQFLQTFGLHFVSYPFWRSDFGFTHFILLVLMLKRKKNPLKITTKQKVATCKVVLSTDDIASLRG